MQLAPGKPWLHGGLSFGWEHGALDSPACAQSKGEFRHAPVQLIFMLREVEIENRPLAYRCSGLAAKRA